VSAAPSVRRTQGISLALPSARTLRWISLMAIAPIGVFVVRAGARNGGDPATAALPVATTLLCVWLSLLFEDVAAETTAASATPLAFRRAVKGAIALPPVVAVWFVYTWIGPLHGPTGPMFGSLLAGVAASLATAAVCVRLVRSSMSGLAAAAVVTFVLLVFPIGVGGPSSVDPATPPLGDPLTYWSTLTLVSIATLAIAHSDRFQRG
jgi:hypothetical protein